jgi:hypothetical protein
VSTELAAATLLGAIAAGCFVAGLCFLRYWRDTRDRFFLFFMASFWIEAANRVHMACTAAWNENEPAHYGVRLLAYALIVLAIWDKNRPGRD